MNGLSHLVGTRNAIDLAVELIDELRVLVEPLSPEIKTQILEAIRDSFSLPLIDATRDSRTNYVKILDFFKSRNNVWASNKEMQEGTSLTRGSIATIVYTTHKDHFLIKGNSPRERRWKLIDLDSQQTENAE